MIDHPLPGAPPPMQPAATAPPSVRRTVLAAAAGFVLAAAIALVLARTGALPDKSAARPSGASIDLPRTFAGYVPVSMTAQARADPKVGRSLAANDHYFTQHTSAALRAAYQGAGAAVSVYHAGKGPSSLEVWAVRAHTPPPVVPYSDPRYLGLAAPVRQVVRIGPVYCDVRRQPVTSGKAVRPEDVYFSSCQRTSSSLTVWVIPSGSDAVIHHPAAVAALVNRMWNEVA